MSTPPQVSGHGAPFGTKSRVPQWISIGFAYYVLTSLIALLGGYFGSKYVQPTAYGQGKERSVVATFAAWDGRWYARIAREGYAYDPEAPSSVAFFPAYPLAGRLLMTVTGWSSELALLTCSHLFLLATFAVLAAYTESRIVGLPAVTTDYVLLIFGLFPTTFFFRMAYSESIFLFFTVLALYALDQNWRWLPTALVIGAATAARPVGVALLAPFALRLLRSAEILSEFGWAACPLPAARLLGLAGLHGVSVGRVRRPAGICQDTSPLAGSSVRSWT